MTEQQKLTQEQQQELTQKVSIFRDLFEKNKNDYLHYEQMPKSDDKTENTKNKIKAIYYKGKLDALRELAQELKKHCSVNS